MKIFKCNSFIKSILVILTILSCNKSKYFSSQKLEIELLSRVKEDFISRKENYLIVYFFKNQQNNYVAISTHDNLYNLKPSLFFEFYGKTVLCIFENLELEQLYLSKKVKQLKKSFDLRNSEMKLDGGLNIIYQIENNSLKSIIPNDSLLESSLINLILFIPPEQGISNSR
jgi:hypothetical protein